jgi:prephenate dehydratase/chorismate mutase/prephenate dehydratase
MTYNFLLKKPEVHMDLKQIREEINRVDYEIIKLLNRRLEMALRTKKFKTQVVDKEREKQVIENVQKIPLKLVEKEFSTKLFENIISECRGIQMEDRKLVAFQGEHGSHAEVAINSSDENFVPIPCPQFIDVVEGVNEGFFDLGILPVEHSPEGDISEVNDLLIDHEIYVHGEIIQPPHYTLLTLPDTDYRSIKVIYSHSQILAHCKGFIDRNQLEARPYYSAGGAAQMITETQLRASAVIATTLCAALHNLAVIKENIQDDDSGYARYLLIAKDKIKEKGDKCSIIFSTTEEFSALYGILKIFNDAKIKITRIESHPSQINGGNVAFLVDFFGCDGEEKVSKALAEVEKKAVMYKLLGCYKSTK